jgi:hypothetical protein
VKIVLLGYAPADAMNLVELLFLPLEAEVPFPSKVVDE